MKWIYVLLTLTLLLCGSGIVSADEDDSSVVIGGIVDMDEVADSGKTFWDSVNRDNNAGYTLLSIGFVAWIIGILVAAFWGSLAHALGKQSQQGDTEKAGTDRLKRVAVAAIAPPVFVILLGISTGLI